MKNIFFKTGVITIIYLSFIIILFNINPDFMRNTSFFIRVIVLFPFLAFILLVLPVLTGMYILEMKKDDISFKNKNFIMLIFLIIYGLFFYLGAIFKLISKSNI